MHLVKLSMSTLANCHRVKSRRTLRPFLQPLDFFCKNEFEHRWPFFKQIGNCRKLEHQITWGLYYRPLGKHNSVLFLIDLLVNRMKSNSNFIKNTEEFVFKSKHLTSKDLMSMTSGIHYDNFHGYVFQARNRGEAL